MLQRVQDIISNLQLDKALPNEVTDDIGINCINFYIHKVPFTNISTNCNLILLHSFEIFGFAKIIVEV